MIEHSLDIIEEGIKNCYPFNVDIYPNEPGVCLSYKLSQIMGF